MPISCTCLLPVYFSRIHKKGSPLFEIKIQYKIYSIIYHDVLENNEDEFLSLGIKKRGSWNSLLLKGGSKHGRIHMHSVATHFFKCAFDVHGKW